MSLPNIVIYTAAFGGYLKELYPAPIDDEVEFICFTDDPNIVATNWKVVVSSNFMGTPTESNRYYKILTHHVLPNYEWSLYVDANIQLLKSPHSMIIAYISSGETFFMPKHYLRSCIYDEAIAVISLGKGNFWEIIRQIQTYKKYSFPSRYGLTENGIMLRKHSDPMIINIMESWWHEFNNFKSGRDQLSLPFIFWKYGKHFHYLAESARNNNKIFLYHPHTSTINNNIVNKIFFFILIALRRLLAVIVLKAVAKI